MIIIKDSNEEGKSEMRTYMRSRMRNGRNYRYGYRTNTTSYKDDESWKDGYECGYREAVEDMENGELEDYRRSRR